VETSTILGREGLVFFLLRDKLMMDKRRVRNKRVIEGKSNSNGEEVGSSGTSPL